MKIKTHRLTAIFIVFSILLICVGCSGNVTPAGTSESTPDINVIVGNESEDASSTVEKTDVTKIYLNKYSTSIEQGCGDTITAAIQPTDATNQDLVWSSDNTAVATIADDGKITAVGVGECKITVKSADNENVFAQVSVTVTPRVAIVENGITYVKGILIANKTYSLPSSYNPGENPEASAALQKMFAAAKADGLSLRVVSGFRSYSTQQQLYNNYVKRDGAAAADRYSARPGHSEHQTGLGFDINMASPGFEGTPEAIWLAQNCHKYGFIIRYPKGKEEITGFMYEPWHLRYLGVETATNVFNSGLCLEEYLGITSKYSY